MGKTKGRGKRSRRAGGAVDIFVGTWKYLVLLHDDKTRFALNLLWRNEKILDLFVRDVLGFCVDSGRVTRSLLYNGYRATLRLFPEMFTTEEWEKIRAVFSNKMADTRIPTPIFSLVNQISGLRKPELQKFVERRFGVWKTAGTFSVEYVPCQAVSAKVRSNVMKSGEERNCFVGDWGRHGYSDVDPRAVKFCRGYPKEFVVVEKTKNFTFLFDNSASEPFLIGMVMQQNVLTTTNKSYIRSLLTDLCEAHPSIRRTSHAFLNGGMVGHGPLYNRFIPGGGKKLSFYTHSIKMIDMIDMFESGEKAFQFDCLLDRQAHGHLVDIILGLYLWWCPQLLTSFFEYSQPYLDTESVPGSLEAALGVKGPSAYQLYVTENFCAELHEDVDVTDFTICYASHPDAASTSPIDFVMASHGLRVPIGDGDLFCFRSSLLHGTGYRHPSANKAYVAAVVVSKSLSDLIRRTRHFL